MISEEAAGVLSSPAASVHRIFIYSVDNAYWLDYIFVSFDK
jgi:hypothetical protein